MVALDFRWPVLSFAAQRNRVAVDRDVQVVLVDAWQLRCDDDAVVMGIDIDRREPLWSGRASRQPLHLFLKTSRFAERTAIEHARDHDVSSSSEVTRLGQTLRKSNRRRDARDATETTWDWPRWRMHRRSAQARSWQRSTRPSVLRARSRPRRPARSPTSTTRPALHRVWRPPSPTNPGQKKTAVA